MTLVVTYATPDPTDTNPPTKDTVLDQNPEPGLTVGPITKVTITVASGPNKVTVPDVTGLSDTDACAKLQKVQLVCQPAGDMPSNQPAGTIVKTDPPALTPVDPHSIVNYWVSQGPPTPTPSATATATACPTVGPGTPTPTPGGPC
jgi:serine/threonine-protein kinase